jgi:uncharacterized membrane protein YgcG
VYVEQLRIVRGSGEMIREKVEEVMRDFKPTVIIMQLMDNTTFEVITEDGKRLPPKKLDGKTHFAGDIAVVDKAVMRKLLVMCRPALDATVGIKTVFIGPLPRYVTGACCRNNEHMGNRIEPGFFLKMKQDLAAVNKEIKDFLYNDDYQHVRAMDPWIGLRHLSPESIWGADPVHMREEHLRYVVEGVQITLAKITPKKRRGSAANSGSKRARSFPGRGGGGSRGVGGGRGGHGGITAGRGGGIAAHVRGQRGGY